MPRRLMWTVACCLLALRAAGAAAPLETYGRLPSLEDAALSPDGTSIAFVRTAEEQRLIVIYSLKERRFLGGVRIGNQKLRSVQWADDSQLLLTTSTTGTPWGLRGSDSEWQQIQAFDVQRHKIRPLLEAVHDVKTLNVVLGSPMVRREGNDTILYLHGLYVSDRTTPGLFRVNLSNGAERIVRQGTLATVGWLVDDAGQLAVEEEYFEHDRRWAIRLARDGHLKEAVSGVEAIDAPRILGFDPARESLVVAFVANDQVVWKTLSLKDGAWGAEFAADSPHGGVIVDPHSQRIIATTVGGDEPQYSFFDPELQERWDWAVRQCRNERVQLVSLSQNHSKALLLVTGASSGYSYQLADFDERLIQPVGKVYDGVDVIAEVRPVSYAAADGLRIPAYLTLPPGRPAKNLPVIVLPHGGPAVRDSLRFDWWAQALAMEGYAVLQPNYRGSDLGRKWMASGFGEWGRKMQSDLSDGLRYLVAQGIADPQRACIVGASYGGYAALAGVTLQSGIYRCAVAVAGVSDPGEFEHWVNDRTRLGRQTSLRFWDRFLGVTSMDDPKLAEISPLKHVPEVTVPVLLIHGRDDTVVPYAQSADMAKALKKAGKTVEFLSLDKEDHWLSRSETRLQMLKASVEFLRRNNPPD
jgi:dipeptidyl aminopeptidase/acylaminoacyl peptidase